MFSTLDYLGLYDPTKTTHEDKAFDLSRMDLEVFNTQLDGDPFDNDEEKIIYVNLPDLRDKVDKEVLLKKDKEALTKTNSDPSTEAFFKRLRECMSIQIADQLAEDFCYINTKKNRKALIEEICLYRNNYLLLTTYQCRLIATLSR
jgi:regulator of nonsense transcripts 2